MESNFNPLEFLEIDSNLYTKEDVRSGRIDPTTIDCGSVDTGYESRSASLADQPYSRGAGLEPEVAGSIQEIEAELYLSPSAIADYNCSECNLSLYNSEDIFTHIESHWTSSSTMGTSLLVDTLPLDTNIPAKDPPEVLPADPSDSMHVEGSRDLNVGTIWSALGPSKPFEHNDTGELPVPEMLEDLQHLHHTGNPPPANESLPDAEVEQRHVVERFGRLLCGLKIAISHSDLPPDRYYQRFRRAVSPLMTTDLRELDEQYRYITRGHKLGCSHPFSTRKHHNNDELGLMFTHMIRDLYHLRNNFWRGGASGRLRNSFNSESPYDHTVCLYFTFFDYVIFI